MVLFCNMMTDDDYDMLQSQKDIVLHWRGMALTWNMALRTD